MELDVRANESRNHRASLTKRKFVKSFIVSAAIGFIACLSACDSAGTGTIESCATSLIGTFDGQLQGPAYAQLASQGTLEVHFLVTDEDLVREREATVTLDDTGVIMTEGGALELMGSFDYDACTASGQWTLFAADTGNWQVGLYQPASF